MPSETGTAAGAAPVDRQRGGGWAASPTARNSDRLRVRAYIGYIALLTLVFVRPLAGLASYAGRDDLHSYVVLAPIVSAYLVYLRRRQSVTYRSGLAGALIAGAVAVAAIVASFHCSAELSRNDGLALMATAVVSLVAAGGFLFLGAAWMAANAFPFAFLLFLIPLPDAAVNRFEHGLVLASADAAAVNFRMWGVPFFRNETTFELRGITLQVARECSGIHSTWALFMMSALTSQLFLRGGWRRLVLIAVVIPLGILRNGFRIFTIAWLCVNVGPEMIDSPIHHRGGPIFFLLSLVPFFLLLWWLRRQEQRQKRPQPTSVRQGCNDR